MMRALLWKEFREQLGRWAPATILLSGLLILVIRSRFVSIREISAFVIIAFGILLSIVLVVEPVPSERTRNTRGFLHALPISRRRAAFAKWSTGTLSIAAMFAVATLTGVLTALWVGSDWKWMCITALCTCAVMMSFHTVLFPFLGQARNELDAAVIAVCIGVIVLAWSFSFSTDTWWSSGPAYLAPAAPLLDVQEYSNDRPGLFRLSRSELNPSLIPLTVAAWVVVPGFALWWPARRRRKR